MNCDINPDYRTRDERLADKFKQMEERFTVLESTMEDLIQWIKEIEEQS